MSGKNPLPNELAYQGVKATNPPQVIISVRAPNTTDKKYPLGTLWVNKVTSVSYQLVTVPGIWTVLGSGLGGDIQTLTGGSGGALTPTAGNMNLLGTANQITSTGSGSTITFSIPAAFIAPGSIAATTTLTATLGNITATNGNIVRGTAGNKDVYSSVATTTAAGANSAGTVTLVGGTATIATTAVTASSQIRLYRQGIGATGAAALGMVTLGTVSAGVSFIINSVLTATATSLATTDVSVIAWEIVN